MISEEKEAIEELKILKEDYWEDDGYGYATAECQKTITALDMAIEALEQQPCEDVISRDCDKCAYYDDGANHEACDECFADEYEHPNFKPKAQHCNDCISRQAVLDINEHHHGQMPNHINHEIWNEINDLPSVIPKEKPRKGEWLRMSNLSEKEDDRYKCSHCGNVVHHKDKMTLYTFNSWCGRCGNDNGRKRGERMTIERARAINEWLDIHCPKCANNDDRGTGFLNCQAECEVQKDIGISCIHYEEAYDIEPQESEET